VITIDAGAIFVATLILLRVSIFVMLMPVMGQKIVPISVKIGLIILLTAILFPIVNETVPTIDVNPISLSILAAKEILLGAALALSAQLVFASVQFAGQLISYQMGLSAANIFDPASSQQVSVVGQLINTFAILIWFSVGAHHIFISGLIESFAISPIGGEWAVSGIGTLLSLGGNLFSVGLQIAGPIMILLFLVNVGLGLISKAVPQIQVFFVSFPLTIGLGLIILMITLPAMLTLIINQFRYLNESMPELMRVFGGG